MTTCCYANGFIDTEAKNAIILYSYVHTFFDESLYNDFSIKKAGELFSFSFSTEDEATFKMILGAFAHYGDFIVLNAQIEDEDMNEKISSYELKDGRIYEYPFIFREEYQEDGDYALFRGLFLKCNEGEGFSTSIHASSNLAGAYKELSDMVTSCGDKESFDLAFAEYIGDNIDLSTLDITIKQEWRVGADSENLHLSVYYRDGFKLFIHYKESFLKKEEHEVVLNFEDYGLHEESLVLIQSNLVELRVPTTLSIPDTLSRTLFNLNKEELEINIMYGSNWVNPCSICENRLEREIAANCEFCEFKPIREIA